MPITMTPERMEQLHAEGKLSTAEEFAARHAHLPAFRLSGPDEVQPGRDFSDRKVLMAHIRSLGLVERIWSRVPNTPMEVEE